MSNSSSLAEILNARDFNQFWHIIEHMHDECARDTILTNTFYHLRSNAARWEVYWATSDPEMLNFFIGVILAHANTLEEVEHVKRCAPCEMAEYINIQIDVVCARKLQDETTTNTERLRISRSCCSNAFRWQALHEVLAHDPTCADLIMVIESPDSDVRLKEEALILMSVVEPS